MGPASRVKIGRRRAVQSVNFCARDEHIPETGRRQRPDGVTGVRHIGIDIDQYPDFRRLGIGSAAHDHPAIGLSDEDEVVVALRLHDIDDLTDMSFKIGRWGGSIAEPRKRDRQGLVPVRGKYLCHLLVDPAALPTSGDQDKSGHVIHP